MEAYHPVETHMCVAKVLPFGDGTREVQRLTIANIL